MQVTYGPYGPYVRQGRSYAPLRDLDPAEVDLVKAIQMIRDKEAAPKAKGPFGRGRRGASGSKAAAAQGSAEGAAETGPAAGGTEAAGPEKGRASGRPKPHKAGKAAGKAGSSKAGKGKSKKASGKQAAAPARAGSKSAWSQFLGSQWPGLKEQQPDISFGDVRPPGAIKSTASCILTCSGTCLVTLLPANRFQLQCGLAVHYMCDAGLGDGVLT